MISISGLKERLEEAGRYMDEGGTINRAIGENIWFSVCKEMLDKIAEIEERLEKIEKQIEKLGINNET